MRTSDWFVLQPKYDDNRSYRGFFIDMSPSAEDTYLGGDLEFEGQHIK